jgi:hypothetical protein
LLQAIETAQGSALIPDERAEELRNFVVLKEGERIATERGSLAAMVYTESAIAKYGRNTPLEDALRVHRQNRVADLHNNFATLYNRRDFESAHQLIRSALEEFPNNRQLESDRSLVEQALRPPRR